MLRILAAIGLGAAIMLFAAGAFCAELYEDSATGQIFTKPGEGRVKVEMPEEKARGLYEDANGAVYLKGGEGRTPVAVASEAGTAAKPESTPAGDYSSQAFTEAVRHVISDDESTTYPKLKVGTLFYGEYFYDFDKEKLNPDGSHGGRNDFVINRCYINFRGEFTPEIKFRVTPDITRFAGASAKGLGSGESVSDSNAGDLELRLKFGYLDFHDFLAAYPSLEVKAGQFETAWLDYEEGLWGYRVLDTMLVEKEGFMNSADLGVGLKGKLPSGYGDWQADVINGEGYHSDENNKFKTVQGRLTFIPMPNNDYLKGLQLAGFASVGRQSVVNTFDLQRDRYIGFVGYKYQNDLFVGAEYLMTRGADSFVNGGNQPSKKEARNFSGAGFSAMAWYRMPFWKPIRILGRVDVFNHDTRKDTSNKFLPSDEVSRYIYGVSYDIGKYVMVVLDDETQITDKGLKSFNKGELNQNLLKLDLQFAFN